MDHNAQNITRVIQSSTGIEKNKNRIYVKDADLQIHVPTPTEAKQLEEGHSFKNILTGYLDEVNTLQHDAESQIQRLIAGETEDVHEVMEAMDDAETAFEMMMEIRNKLISGYQEVMRMQI